MYWRKTVSSIPRLGKSIWQSRSRENGRSNGETRTPKENVRCLSSSFTNKNKGFLGEGGLKISGGQKQRIGIARALYFNRQILILDESLNAIDLKTSKKILRNILNNYPDLTVILVTHSQALAKMTKKIYKIKDKKLTLNIK